MEFRLARLAGQGDPNLRKHGKWVVDWRFLGVGNNQSSRVQATRLYTTSYQTVRIQDWKDKTIRYQTVRTTRITKGARMQDDGKR